MKPIMRFLHTADWHLGKTLCNASLLEDQALALEELLAGVWAEVLGLDRIGVNESFFDLGGHSLLAVQTHRRLKETLNRPLSITDIFRFPVVSALAAHLGKSITSVPSGASAPPVPDMPAAPLAASAAATGDSAADTRIDAMARRRAMREAREKALG